MIVGEPSLHFEILRDKLLQLEMEVGHCVSVYDFRVLMKCFLNCSKKIEEIESDLGKHTHTHTITHNKKEEKKEMGKK